MSERHCISEDKRGTEEEGEKKGRKGEDNEWQDGEGEWQPGDKFG